MGAIKRGLFSSGDSHSVVTSYGDVVMTGEQNYGHDSNLPLGQHFSIRSVVFRIATVSDGYDSYIMFYLKMSPDDSSNSAVYIAPINMVDELSARYDFNPPLDVQIDPSADWSLVLGQETANTIRLCCRTENGTIVVGRTEVHWEQTD